MPRHARTVVVNTPHVITQRGNRGEDVFFSDEDYKWYLHWLGQYAIDAEAEVLAYCLTASQVQILLVPRNADSFRRIFRPLHIRYTQRINSRNSWTGHLWQGRFLSSPVDTEYMWAATKYIERTPVRLGLVQRAEDYAWSSAAPHCRLRGDMILTQDAQYKALFGQIENWSDWLAQPDIPGQLALLTRNIEKGLPCGGSEFINRLEDITGRSLTYRPRGRPPKKVFEFRMTPRDFCISDCELE